MPSKRPIVRFHHIVENVEAIRTYMRDATREDFVQASMRRDAVERCPQRIAEAARKLGDDAETYAPGPPWPEIRGLGNRLRHEYDVLLPDRLWTTVQRDLDPLYEAAVAAIARLEREERS